MTQLTPEEQRQVEADLNAGMQLAIDERDLGARAELQKRAAEIAGNLAVERAKRQVNSSEAKAASAVAAQQARFDEAHAEAEGAPFTPGDDVAKAAAAGAAVEAEQEADEVEDAETVAASDASKATSAAKADAENTVDDEGPNQGDPDDRANAASDAKAAAVPKGASDSKALNSGTPASKASDSKALKSK